LQSPYDYPLPNSLGGGGVLFFFAKDTKKIRSSLNRTPAYSCGDSSGLYRIPRYCLAATKKHMFGLIFIAKLL